MFTIVNHRLIAKKELTKEDFDAIAQQSGKAPFMLKLKKKYRPSVAIRFADRRGHWVTYNDTGKENDITYQPGDAFITRLTEEGKVDRGFENQPNTYIIGGEDVPLLFEHLPDEENITEDGKDFGAVYAGKNIVEAIPFQRGLNIICHWGRQTIDNQVGYLFYSHITQTVYGCDEGGMRAFEPYIENNTKVREPL